MYLLANFIYTNESHKCTFISPIYKLFLLYNLDTSCQFMNFIPTPCQIMNESLHLPTKHDMLQNAIQVFTMHPFPHPPKEHVIIITKSVQMPIKNNLIVISYCLWFSIFLEVMWQIHLHPRRGMFKIQPSSHLFCQ